MIFSGRSIAAPSSPRAVVVTVMAAAVSVVDGDDVAVAVDAVSFSFSKLLWSTLLAVCVTSTITLRRCSCSCSCRCFTVKPLSIDPVVSLLLIIEEFVFIVAKVLLSILWWFLGCKYLSLYWINNASVVVV